MSDGYRTYDCKPIDIISWIREIHASAKNGTKIEVSGRISRFCDAFLLFLFLALGVFG